MELALAENIRAFRKQRKLTQEQLAEVLGVTVGAVHKWETGLSVPELNLIVKMADFFDASVDVLLGYKMKDNRFATIIRRLKDFCRTRDPEALAEAEKALKKYPNSFEIVHICARVYSFFGVGNKGQAETRRALELFEQARLMIAQNTDPRISDITICGEIAGAWIQLGEIEKSVSLLKENNAGGIFSDSIGICLAMELNRPEEAEPFLADALLGSTGSLINAIAGYSILLSSRGDFVSAGKMLALAIDFLDGLKKENTSDFIDKIMAILLAQQAHIRMISGQAEEAAASLREARDIATRFDAAPNYSVSSLRFTIFPEDVTTSDILGTTASDSIENILHLLGDRRLADMWKEMVRSGE